MRSIILLAVSAVFMASCKGSGPLVDVCISFPEKSGFVCVDRDQKAYFLTYAESAKYVAFSPDDAKALIDACGLPNKSAVAVKGYLKRAETLAMGAYK